ncbi:MAG: hypothetical protein ACLPKT_26125, partial [Methylocella sp.]
MTKEVGAFLRCEVIEEFAYTIPKGVDGALPFSSSNIDESGVPQVLTCREQTERAANRLKWPASSRNRGRFQIGMVAGFKSESPAGLNRNS